jgi:hypothetical protein
MKQIVLIATALAVYGLVAACVLWPGNVSNGANGRGHATPDDRDRDGVVADDDSTKTAAEPIAPGHASPEGLPFRSITLQIQRVDWIDQYKKSIDEIANVGADTVMFVVDARQENGSASFIWLDMRFTPTVEQLSDLIKYAKSKNLRVVLMPIVLLQNPIGNEWRGTIKPQNWPDWWNAYRDMITHFAYIAEGNHADMLVVGSELVSTESNVKEWTKTIQAVRKIFKGRLTYSSNWDHYTAVPFWDQLDMIGMNSYWKLGKDKHATVDEIKQSWRNIQADLLPFVKQQGKPLMFLEIGWFSQENVAYEPWDYTKPVDEVPIDLEIQKRLYQGFFESWFGKPELGGFSVWEWSPGNGGPDNAGYTPENKPAEQVLREWLAKKPWTVKVK